MPDLPIGNDGISVWRKGRERALDIMGGGEAGDCEAITITPHYIHINKRAIEGLLCV